MGAILGVDHGAKRIGIALSDRERRLASPLEVYERRGDRPDERHFLELIATNEVERIVIGLPLHGHGAEGPSAQAARDWGRWLGARSNRPISFFDERYSTRIAEDLLREGGLKASRRRALRDMIAAQLILQAYLDAGCPVVEVPGQPLDDSALTSNDGGDLD